MKINKLKLMIGLISISCIITFSGCAAKGDTQRQELDKNGKKITVISNSEGSQSLNITAKNSVDSYLSLIGVRKDKVSDLLGETPVPIDEGGSMFKKTGIRVWYKNQVVDQIFTQSKDIDFNNAKIGDNISSFKKAFGEPISDKNNDAHFKYKNVFISVQYDKESGKTFAVYILKDDF